MEKRIARLKNAKAAHDDLVAAAHRAQADALEIEAAAKRRLADEYDAAQERGEIAGHGGGRNFKVGDSNVEANLAAPNRVGDDNAIITAADLGLRRDQIHDARLIRNAEAVAEHFEEAFRTLRRLPPVKAQGFSNAWPDFVRSAKEIAAMEPEPMRVWPSPSAITRLEQTFDWVLWIDEPERRLIWSRAARVPWKQITFELGVDRSTAWRRWQLALTKIAARLNAH
jgi:hypothetical protein